MCTPSSAEAGLSVLTGIWAQVCSTEFSAVRGKIISIPKHLCLHWVLLPSFAAGVVASQIITVSLCSQKDRMRDIKQRTVETLSVAKKGPFTKEYPPSTFGPISCIGSKFIWMSAHPGASFASSLRSTASSAMRVSGKKLCVILHRN